MPGDIDVIFTADDKDVSVGLDRLARKAGGFSAEMAKATGKVKEQLTGFKNIGPAVGGALAASVGIASKAVLDYAEKNDLVRSKLDAIRSASQNLWTGIGRDISNLLGGEGADLLRWAERMRQGLVDGIAGALNPEAGGVGEANRATEEMIAAAKQAAALRAEEKSLRASILADEGDTVAAARLRAQEERRAALERLNALKLQDGAEKAALVRLIDRRAALTVQMAVEKKAAEERAKYEKALAEDTRLDARDRSDREAVERYKEQQALARERLDFELEAARVAAMRGKATAEEVERAERELNLRQKLAELNKNEYLSDAEKAAAAAQLRKFSESEALGRSKESKAKVIAIDGGINATGGAIAAAVGAAAAPQVLVAKQTRDASLRTAKAVEQIARNGLSAAFA